MVASQPTPKYQTATESWTQCESSRSVLTRRVICSSPSITPTLHREQFLVLRKTPISRAPEEYYAELLFSLITATTSRRRYSFPLRRAPHSGAPGHCRQAFYEKLPWSDGKLNCGMCLCIALFRDRGHSATMSRSFSHISAVSVIVIELMSIAQLSASLMYSRPNLIMSTPH